MEDKCILPVLVASRTGYQNLCRLMTNARLRGSKTESTVLWQELPAYAEGLLALTGDEEGILQDPCHPQTPKKLEQLTTAFGKGMFSLKSSATCAAEKPGATNSSWPSPEHTNFRSWPPMACSMREPDARRALDLFTCARNHTTFDSAGRLLSINAERHLKSAAQMERLFADLPEAVENTAKVAERLEFSLENLGYEFPKYPVPPGETMDSFLRTVAFAGARARYSHLSAKVLKQLNFELDLIERPRLLRLFSHRLGHRELLQPERHFHAGARQRGQ